MGTGSSAFWKLKFILRQTESPWQSITNIEIEEISSELFPQKISRCGRIKTIVRELW